MPITLTSRAADKVQSIMKDNDLVDHVVRVAVAVDTTASRFDYAFDIVDDVEAADRTFESSGVKVVCDPRSYLWLNGTEVDFSEDAGGFQFDNPLEP